jgi:hypothetical protein
MRSHGAEAERLLRGFRIVVYSYSRQETAPIVAAKDATVQQTQAVDFEEAWGDLPEARFGPIRRQWSGPIPQTAS